MTLGGGGGMGQPCSCLSMQFQFSNQQKPNTLAGGCVASLAVLCLEPPPPQPPSPHRCPLTCLFMEACPQPLRPPSCLTLCLAA